MLGVSEVTLENVVGGSAIKQTTANRIRDTLAKLARA